MSDLVSKICEENIGVMWRQGSDESYRDRIFRAGVEATLDHLKRNGVYRIDTSAYPNYTNIGMVAYGDIDVVQVVYKDELKWYDPSAVRITRMVFDV